MALVNQAKREINAKIVFFGPGLSGKATNVKHIFNKLKPEFRGALKAMNVQASRMLFFDFIPPGDSSVDGHKVRFHIYTVSGAEVDPAAWKMVLKGVDGIVFVADASPDRKDANRESLDTLAGYLKGYGQSLSSIPLVFQYNKSDLSDALPPAELERLLNPAHFPSFTASSHIGEGVLQTALGLVKTVLTGLRDKGLQGGARAEELQQMVEPSPASSAPAAPGPAAAAPAAPSAPAAPAAPAAAAAAGTSGRAFESQPGFVGSEWPPAYGPVTDRGGEETEEPLSLELGGSMEAVAPGKFRLPLTIRSGARSKSVVLHLALSLEEVTGGV